MMNSKDTIFTEIQEAAWWKEKERQKRYTQKGKTKKQKEDQSLSCPITIV